MIRRIISPELSKVSKSVLLLGPRQVGKSTLMASLKPELSINLADEVEFLRHSSQPGELRSLIETLRARTIFIDEVQRLPKILNTVQALVDSEKKMKFYLTGSSARKLKRGGANLLPGRVLNYKLGPLVSAELSYKMNTAKVLSLGCLPEVYLGTSEKLSKDILRSYVASYLREEIQSEALTRNLDAFARFLQESILLTGQFVDYSKIAKRAKISRHSCPRYFEILEDTLVGQRVYPFSELIDTLDLIKHPKFYFFDNGVFNGLLGNFVASLDRVGVLCEQLVYNQLMHSSWAKTKDLTVNTFRLRTGEEIDFIINIDNQIFAIEVKHSQEINMDDLKGLQFFDRIYTQHQGLFVFHMGTRQQKLGKIWSLPWQTGLKELGL